MAQLHTTNDKWLKNDDVLNLDVTFFVKSWSWKLRVKPKVNTSNRSQCPHIIIKHRSCHQPFYKDVLWYWQVSCLLWMSFPTVLMKMVACKLCSLGDYRKFWKLATIFNLYFFCSATVDKGLDVFFTTINKTYSINNGFCAG